MFPLFHLHVLKKVILDKSLCEIDDTVRRKEQISVTLSIILVDRKPRHAVRVGSESSVLCESDLTLAAKLESFHLLPASALGSVQVLKWETHGGVKSQPFLVLKE